MENVTSELAPIVAREIPEDERLQFLPRHFGRNMVVSEFIVYDWMGKLCADYGGGLWKFYDLDNDGFYMAPDRDELMHLAWADNGYAGDMSADAAGIVASLFTLNSLVWRTQSEALERAYYGLRDFAAEHTEARAILAAID